MTLSEFIAKLGSTVSKSLTDAKALLAECATHLTAAVARIGELETSYAAAQEAITALKASLVTAEASVTSLTGEKNALTEELATVTTGTLAALAAGGIKVEKIDAESIKVAAKARAESIGHELLAARGTKPLPEKIKSADTVADSDLSSDAKILAAYEAMSAGPDRVAFLEKHEAAIWRAHTAK